MGINHYEYLKLIIHLIMDMLSVPILIVQTHPGLIMDIFVFFSKFNFLFSFHNLIFLERNTLD